MNRYVENLLRFRWPVLIGIALLWVLLVWSASGLHLEEDVLALLPENEQMDGYRTLLDEFNPMNSVLISVYSDSSETRLKEDIIAAADSLYQKLLSTGQFTKITYRWNLNDLQKTMEVLQNHRQMLFTAEDSAKVADRLEYSEVVSRLKEWKKTLAETPSPLLASELVKDPLGFNDILISKMNQTQSANANTAIYKGRIFNKAGDHLLMVAYPEISSMESAESANLVSELKKLFRDFETKYDLKVAWIASHRFSVENAGRIKSDLQLTISVALMAIVILSLLVYTRPVLMLFTLLPALFGSAFSLGIIHWIDPNISAIIIGTGAMLIGIAVDYGIHFLYHADQLTEPLNDENIAGLVNRIQKPLLMSAGTTIFAFMALQFSGMPAYTQLGWFVSLGILGAVLFVLIVFPVILSWMKHQTIRRAIINPGGLIQKGITNIIQKKGVVLIVILSISLLLIPGLLQLQFEGDVQKLNSGSKEIKQDVDELTTAFGNVMTSTLVMAESQDIEKALQKSESLAVYLQELIPGKISGITHLLPSQRIQLENQQRWKALFTEREIQSLKVTMNKAAKEAGFRSGSFDIFISDLSEKSTVIDWNTYTNTILESVLSGTVKVSPNSARILTTVSIDPAGDFSNIRSGLKEKFPDVVIYNGKHFVEQTISLILQELEQVGLIALIFVVLILLFFSGSIKRTLILLLPLGVSMLWTFGILGWIGVRVNIINSLVSVFVFGLVVDYCIFLSTGIGVNTKQELDPIIKNSGGSIAISATTTIIGIGVLMFAKHPALFSLGLTASTGIISGFVSTVLILSLFFKKPTAD